MGSNELFKVYQTCLRPSVEYSSVVYHSLTPDNVSNKLEALQKRASKIIFGTNSSYTDVINEGKIELLESRRKELCLKFARKAANNEIFGPKWFPENPRTVYNTRRPDLYREERPKTERFKRNPINYMRHELNKENRHTE